MQSPRRSSLPAGSAVVVNAGKDNPPAYGGYRKLLEHKDAGSVVNATPPDSHARRYLDVLAAEKDLYGEKTDPAEGSAGGEVGARRGKGLHMRKNGLRKVSIAGACLAMAFSAASFAAGLPRSAPEDQGVSSAALIDFVTTLDRKVEVCHGVMVLRHGHVVAEGWWAPYDAVTRHALWSLSKSFTSTAVGMAIAEGKLSLDDEVLKFFPEDAPPDPSGNLRNMRVRDLLCMSTGHQAEPSVAGTPDWPKTFLAQPVPFKPGTHFLYNTPATYMCAAIVRKATGQNVLDFLRPRLFDPLGIEEPTWGTCPQGTSLGGYGLSVRTEDIARFGQLYLQKGVWQGRRLVPAAWIEAATSRQTSNGSNPRSDWDQGYGYQFWRCRHGAFRGDGAFGQFCIVMPDRDAVVAITAGTNDMQHVLDIVWDKLLPALGDAKLPADAEAQKSLASTLAALTLRPVEGAAAPGAAAVRSGARFAFPANDDKLDALALEFGDGKDGATLVLSSGGVEQRIACGKGAWTKGTLAYGTTPRQQIAASGAWTAENSYTVKMHLTETPANLTVTLKFAGEQIVYDAEFRATFGPGKRPQLVGRRQ